MPYDAEFTARAEDDLSRLDSITERRVRNKVYQMAASAASWPHEALTGPFRGYLRLRAGDYRVLYVCDHARRRIAVHQVGHRSEVYD